MLLEVQDLNIEYGSVGAPNHGVIDASFSVDDGEIVGIVGESGSGKSSAMLAVLGLTREGGRVASGSVKFEGHELLGLTRDEWRAFRGSKIGLVTQNPRASLNPVRRVGEQIAAVYRSHREATKAQARERSLELMRLVGINDPVRRLEAYPHELSGGMAQRVLIAIALSCSPKLLIADEPTSGLDATVQAQVLDDLRRVAKEVGSSLALVTHDLGVVANYCDRVYVMESGEVVEESDVHTFFARPAHPASLALLSKQQETSDEAVRLRGAPLDRIVLPSGCFLHPRCVFAEEESGCMTEHPALYDVASDHRSRCHRHVAVRDATRSRFASA